jgi:hypothetical protein
MQGQQKNLQRILKKLLTQIKAHSIAKGLICKYSLRCAKWQTQYIGKSEGETSKLKKWLLKPKTPPVQH